MDSLISSLSIAFRFLETVPIVSVLLTIFAFCREIFLYCFNYFCFCFIVTDVSDLAGIFSLTADRFNFVYFYFGGWSSFISHAFCFAARYLFELIFVLYGWTKVVYTISSLSPPIFCSTSFDLPIFSQFSIFSDVGSPSHPKDHICCFFRIFCRFVFQNMIDSCALIQISNFTRFCLPF